MTDAEAKHLLAMKGAIALLDEHERSMACARNLLRMAEEMAACNSAINLEGASLRELLDAAEKLLGGMGRSARAR